MFTFLDKRREEQNAYTTMHQELKEEFLSEPQAFLNQHGKRPEDFTGADFRSLMCTSSR